VRTNGIVAADWMMRQSMAGSTKINDGSQTFAIHGYCLKVCRMAWGLPGSSTDAIAEWARIPKKYKHNNPLDAPIGAPHFWDIGAHGHVALQAHKADYIWTTDLPVDNMIGLMSGAGLKARWGGTYLGWSTYFEGYDLSGKLSGPAPA